MASLEIIANTINNALPYHHRAIVRPEEIQATRAVSCFGRAALVGAALLLDSRPEASLSLLISESHGAKRRPGKYWFGHAELVVDTGEESALVLTARRVAFGDLQSTNWLPGLRPEEQDVITGLAPRATGFGEDTVTPSEVMSYLAGIVDADETEFSARNRYRAYSFAEGVERYQLDHPDLRAGPIVQVADYINLYNRLTTA